MHSAKCARSTKEQQHPIIAALILRKIFLIVNWLLYHVCKSKNLPHKRLIKGQYGNVGVKSSVSRLFRHSVSFHYDVLSKNSIFGLHPPFKNSSDLHRSINDFLHLKTRISGLTQKNIIPDYMIIKLKSFRAWTSPLVLLVTLYVKTKKYIKQILVVQPKTICQDSKHLWHFHTLVSEIEVWL